MSRQFRLSGHAMRPPMAPTPATARAPRGLRCLGEPSAMTVPPPSMQWRWTTSSSTPPQATSREPRSSKCRSGHLATSALAQGLNWRPCTSRHLAVLLLGAFQSLGPHRWCRSPAGRSRWRGLCCGMPTAVWRKLRPRRRLAASCLRVPLFRCRSSPPTSEIGEAQWRPTLRGIMQANSVLKASGTSSPCPRPAASVSGRSKTTCPAQAAPSRLGIINLWSASATA
mmetsp:Transcript_114836/g.245159  ORF Transcript_114836/g.245159 Transcript_114836/m.245159 type:complete len:226 (+) Transcript_114836:230-907(+)